MPRTTVDIDATILRDLKKLQKQERKSLGRLMSELLAQALGQLRKRETKTPFRWIVRDMGAPLVDLDDKDALYRVLDRPKDDKGTR